MRRRSGPGAARVENQGAALLHVLEEVAQHHGQAELTRDQLRSRGH